jgi:hypothetical protein
MPLIWGEMGSGIFLLEGLDRANHVDLVAKIRRNAQGDYPWILTETNARQAASATRFRSPGSDFQHSQTEIANNRQWNLKNSRFWETGTGDRVRSAPRGRQQYFFGIS